jgi:molybdopterin molybdotransferase
MTPEEAIIALCGRINRLGTESVALSAASGRILAESLVTDRDSPPCDVSSMDGFALRLTDTSAASVPTCGESVPGRSPPKLLPGHAVRIVTGAPLPQAADVVIPIEQLTESSGSIQISPSQHALKPGQNIRRQGENLSGGSQFATAGELCTPPLVAAMVAFGQRTLSVFRRVRISIVNTGQELVGVDKVPSQWQIRDSNGPSIAALFAAHAWVDCESNVRVPDEPEQIEAMLSDRFARCDAVILTGAVSVGPYDHVPAILQKLGCVVEFHRLPLRPGKPVLGGVGPSGQVIFGLPGNPVSALVCARRLALPVLAHQAGVARRESPAMMRLENDGATLPLWWYRLVRCSGDGLVQPVETHGSGDLVSLARSDGFVEIPPNCTGEGPWPYFPWHG